MTSESPLTKAQGEALNRLHMSHISAVIAEQRAHLLHGSPNYQGPTPDEATTRAWEARCNYYRHVHNLTGGQTSL